MKWIKKNKKNVLNGIAYLAFIFMIIPRIYLGEYQWTTLWIILAVFLALFCWMLIYTIIEVKKDLKNGR